VQPSAETGKTIWEDAERLTEVNRRLLANFLEAMADSLPKRVLLQFGMKYYGVHLGPANYPREKADPRVGEQNEPNYYYAQHDYPQDFCGRHGTEWVDATGLGARRRARCGHEHRASARHVCLDVPRAGRTARLSGRHRRMASARPRVPPQC
jgi:hypothetical protein